MLPAYTLTTPPATEPIDIDQAAEHLRVDNDQDFVYLQALIAVAREYVDSITGRVSGASTWKLAAPSWAALAKSCVGREISIGRTPLVSVESVKYYAPDASTLTVMDAADYLAITAAEPGVLMLTGSIPPVADRPDAIQIEFTAGYTNPQLVPAIHRHAVKMVVGHLYENRLPVAFASCQEIPHTLAALLQNQKVGGWIG